ncbi:MAG: DUF1569 domain-containing protein [Planctomycetes bacterium]|nr:DUF1569 domain-containing protein [Planctomycetota bacterium]
MAALSLFDRAGREALLARVQAMTPASPRQWGKMDVGQMLAHLQVGLRVALGDTKLKRSLLGLLFGRMAKRSALGEKPFSKGLPTDATFKIRDARDVAREKTALLALIERFGAGGPAVVTSDPHPFFGPMTPPEWDVLMAKHLDHHLRQFGG